MDDYNSVTAPTLQYNGLSNHWVELTGFFSTADFSIQIKKTISQQRTTEILLVVSCYPHIHLRILYNSHGVTNLATEICQLMSSR